MGSDRLRVEVRGAGEGAERTVTVTVATELGLAVTVDMSRQGALHLADSLRKAAGPALVVANDLDDLPHRLTADDWRN